MKNINPRTLTAFFHDTTVALLCWYASYQLRFNFQVPTDFKISALQNSLWVIPIEIILFIVFGLYKGVWRFASLPDIVRISKANFFSFLAIVVVILMISPGATIPRTVVIINSILCLLVMSFSRLTYRLWKEYRLYGHALAMGQPVVVIGSNDYAISLVHELGRGHEWRVIGLINDSSHMRGRYIQNIPVIGDTNELPVLIKKHNVQHVIIAEPKYSFKKRQRIIDSLANLEVKILTIPKYEDLVSGRVDISQVRNIEVEDLLGREQVNLDLQGLTNLIKNQVIMVTGAGGSIGSELCRQILKYHPSEMIFFDHSEFNLYKIEQELTGIHQSIRKIYVVSDVRNESRVKQVLETYKPVIVFHAAAYKHVPMMENDNVCEALSNNVEGTYNIANLSKSIGVKKFVLISTDKAVNPTNVMGASKRLAELVCQGLHQTNSTQFITVRFGNVLGSSGSVIPRFREQILRGGPVTVTHPEITRYFMSIPEAAQLVLQASYMGQGGEIMVLDMGEPVKILDLAKDMIKLSGYHHDEIKIEFSGLRPGEKLYEELLADDENTLPTPHPKLRIAAARQIDFEWIMEMLSWIKESKFKDEIDIKKDLSNWVEEYSPDIQETKQTVKAPIHSPSYLIH